MTQLEQAINTIQAELDEVNKEGMEAFLDVPAGQDLKRLMGLANGLEISLKILRALQ